MIIYDWFQIINVDEFLAKDLPSLSVTLIFEGLGQKEILVMKGNSIDVLYDGVFLTAEFNDKNPFEFDGHAVYIDANRDLYLGIAVAP